VGTERGVQAVLEALATPAATTDTHVAVPSSSRDVVSSPSVDDAEAAVPASAPPAGVVIPETSAWVPTAPAPLSAEVCQYARFPPLLYVFLAPAVLRWCVRMQAATREAITTYMRLAQDLRDSYLDGYARAAGRPRGP
jgi:hypothetical protein